MRTKRFAKQIALVSVLILLGACASKPKEEIKPETPTAVPPAAAAPAPAQVVQPSVAQSPLHDPNNILSKRSVYFAYDKYDVSSEYQPLVIAHARYLRDHAGAKVAIQGNCDERGSREYNLALGQRRADAVGKIMALSGVPSGQIETVSFGKEKPRATGENEAAWAENRRSDIVYQREN
jgi:peptidoglycan-associated lipoprotein